MNRGGIGIASQHGITIKDYGLKCDSPSICKSVIRQVVAIGPEGELGIVVKRIRFDLVVIKRVRPRGVFSVAYREALMPISPGIMCCKLAKQPTFGNMVVKHNGITEFLVSQSPPKPCQKLLPR